MHCIFSTTYIFSGKSIDTKQIEYFWNPHEPNESDEEYTWTSADNIETIYTYDPSHDAKDQKLGFKDVIIFYYSSLNGLRLDEIYESSFQFFTILMLRLRSKMRNGLHNCVITAQSTGTDSIIDTLLEKLEDLTEPDSDYSDNENITSLKLSRHLLFSEFEINAPYVIKIYNEYGKELRLYTSLKKDCKIFNPNATGYNSSVKSLLISVMNRNKKKNVKPFQFSCFNGLRDTNNFNTKNVKISTNVFVSKLNMSAMNIKQNKYPIRTTLGRKQEW